MHGNESTTTKALLDLMHELKHSSADLLNDISLLLIPMLNPDGALDYTRFNASNKDLNRDALDLSQPESVVLRKAFTDFSPNYCFNLHDQRTIYSVGSPRVPATLSLLAPATEVNKGFPEHRKIAAQLVAGIAACMDGEIGVGRYDDSFNPNCVGDYFQSKGVSTLLIEAGHFPKDYEREVTRFYVYRALWAALEAIVSGGYQGIPLSQYHRIPENEVGFVDILIKNAQIAGLDDGNGSRIGVHYDEELHGEQVQFIPRIVENTELGDRSGHEEWDLREPTRLEQLKKSPELWALLTKHSG
jgi:hypothetical protein